MRSFSMILFVLFAACSRPLTDTEEKFAKDLFGDTLNTSRITVSQGLGLLPPYRTVPASLTVLRGTDKACVRTPQPRGAQPPQAFALYDRMHFDSTLYSSDMALGWPHGLRFPNALVLAHELTHVWQWQNRRRTGYTPARAVAESWRFADPYFSTSGDAPVFFAFGYEQQAAMVEDFVCFTIANYDHPRREELRVILEPVLPVEAFEASIER